jgi:chromosome segregation ATPase
LRKVNFQVNAGDMMLWGLEPKAIQEIASKAIEFFLYQKRQELAFHQHLIRQRDSKLENIEKESNEKMEALRTMNNSLEVKVQNMEREVELRTKAYKTLEAEFEEKSRQCKQFEVVMQWIVASFDYSFRRCTIR